MKRVLMVVLVLFAVYVSLFAGTFINNDGVAETISEQTGTFSTMTLSNAPLTWTCRVTSEGNIDFTIKEGGVDVRLKTLPTSSSTYSVKLSFSGGPTRSYSGSVNNSTGVYNTISMKMGSDYIYLLDYTKMTVTISGFNSTYYLGTVDIGELKYIFFPHLITLADVEGSCGGFVFYDKGYYSDGWRYLEAAPADLRVVDGIPTVDKNAVGYSQADSGYVFGYFRTASSGNLYVNGSTKYNSVDCTNEETGSGEKNTELLVTAMGDETWTSGSGATVTWYYAAKLCSDLVYEVDGVKYDDWFLPSKDELNLMYTLLHRARVGNFSGNYYWSSSESDDGTGYAWRQYFSNGSLYDDHRYSNYGVRPVRAF